MNPFGETPVWETSFSKLSISERLKGMSKKTRRLLVFAVLGCLVVGYFVFTALREQPHFEIVSATEIENVETISDTTSNPEAESILSDASELVVYVSGAVVSPGLVTLTTADRIGDAIAAAGGFGADAETSSVNLAEHLVDGLHIHIPTKSELASGWRAPPSSVPGSVSSNSSSTDRFVIVNINTADSATLETLAGIGPATAQRIIDYRTAHGAFKTKEDIKNVSGIGDKKYEAIADYITV